MANTVDTQTFYKLIQQNKHPPSNKLSMVAVVEDWGTEKIHREGAHSALVDPLVLGMISSERRLRIRFHEFGMLGGTLDIDINTVKFRFG